MRSMFCASSCPFVENILYLSANAVFGVSFVGKSVKRNNNVVGAGIAYEVNVLCEQLTIGREHCMYAVLSCKRNHLAKLLEHEWFSLKV